MSESNNTQDSGTKRTESDRTGSEGDFKRGSVHLQNLRKEFGDLVAVDGVNLKIESGEFLTLLGPSGCGKSTTLRMISGLETPTDGDVAISGKRVTAQSANSRDTSMVFQEWALFPHMTVGENISFGLEMDGVPEDERETRIADALEMVELSGYEDRQATELSGGQKQRVAMARAVVREPDVLLLDEPLASLDRKLRQHMQVELKDIQEELGITFIYVTHDQEEALTMSDRIAVMNDGQIEQIGPVDELYTSPETQFVATFIGETNLFEGTISNDGMSLQTDDGRFTVSIPHSADDSGRSAAVSVRPEEVVLKPYDDSSGYANEWTGTILDTIYKGSLKLYRIDVNGKHFEVERQINEETTNFAEDDEVTVSFPTEACRIILD
ncbi:MULTISPECIES: ABC transporter ATP-binding protein [unclassified Halorubrum]|uniref:ABC transporter ATP-binding protein n=1 Tax=unclassified Halorubrum TaxID=2642239 RepID=UPI001BAFC086|nr:MULTISPECIES: ABC transporter ATP-binding protein [unclassified Halorubrum]